MPNVVSFEKSERPAPIFFRIKSDLNQRLIAVCVRHQKERNDLARAGLEHEIARLEAKASPISPGTARLIAEAIRLGVDVHLLLQKALTDAAPTNPQSGHS